MNLESIAERIKNINIPLQEKDILNFLKITRRWPFKNNLGHSSTDLIEFEWDKKDKKIDYEKLKAKAEYIKKMSEHGK